MGISFDKAFGVHPYALQLRVERSQILAGNLANVDTPGYLARDIDYQSALRDVQSSVERAPLQAGGALPSLDYEQLYRVPYQPTTDGNTAELGPEQTRFAANAMDFQTSLTFLNIKINGLAQAIRGE
jgi:flagellar basal-body rod protein FlgB